MSVVVSLLVQLRLYLCSYTFFCVQFTCAFVFVIQAALPHPRSPPPILYVSFEFSAAKQLLTIMNVCMYVCMYSLYVYICISCTMGF